MLPPPGAYGSALVVAGVIKHDDNGLIGGQRLGEVVQKCHEGRLPFLVAERLDDASAGIVHRAIDHEFAIRAGRGDRQRGPFLAPDFRQVRMGVDFTLIEIDQMGSSGLSKRFFCSHSSSRVAVAPASAFWRWVRSGRGRR